MHTFSRLLLIAALCLPTVALGQPGERDPGPRGDGPPERRGDRPERDRRGDHEDREDRWGEREPVPIELVKPALATIRELHPGAPWLERIEQLIEEDREEAAKALGRFPRILELIETRKSRPEEFALHVKNGALMREIFSMVRDYRVAKRDEDQATMDALRPQIREKTEAVFDIRIKIEQMKIERMKRELAEAEGELEAIIAGREGEIDKRMHDMLDRAWERRRRGSDNDGGRRRDRDQDADKSDIDKPDTDKAANPGPGR